MTDPVQNAMEAIRSAITEPAIEPSRPKPVAEGIIARSEAEAHAVHAYALEQLDVITHMVNDCRRLIDERKKSREAAHRAYIETVNDSVAALRPIEDVLRRIAEAVDKT